MASRISPYVDNTGLVFAYDLANVNRSYLGEPTVNYCSADPNLVANIDCSTANATAVLPSRDIGTVRRVTVVADTYGGIIRASLTHNLPSSGIPQAGQSYTISCWIRNSSGVAVAAGWEPEVGQPDSYLRPNIESGFNGNYGSNSQPNTLSPNWTRVSYTYSYNSTQTSQIVPFIYFGHPVGGSGSGIGATIDFYQIQIEVKSHATPYTAGTRSVTQGLRDLTGRSTIDLTNVSFDANAQKTFDGTNDYVEMSSFNIDQNNEFTLEAIIYPNTVSGNQSIIKKNTSNDNWPIFSMTLVGSNIDGYYSSPTYGQCLEGAYGTSGIITANKFWHVAYSKGVGGYTTMKLYINGVSVPYNNFLYGSHINSIATSTKPIHIGRNLDGASWVQPFNGIIPVSRVYNRQLTDSEIQQNFNAIKGRYGL